MSRGPSGQPSDRDDGQVHPDSSDSKGGRYGKTRSYHDVCAELAETLHV